MELVQLIWNHRNIPADLGWKISIFISKGNIDNRGIGLLEVLWKVMQDIIDTCIKKVVTFNYILHGFCAGRVTRTAIMKLELAQELASMDQDPILLVLLDPRKVHDNLD